jgi:hypothetical protein
MNDKKITTGLDKLDECLKGGIKKGDLGIFHGKPAYKSNLIKLSPTEKDKEYRIDFSLNQSDEVTKKGMELLRELMNNLFIKEMENHTVTKYEKIGDTIFPVNYHSDGIITVDYPDSLFCNRVKNKTNEK